MACADGTLRGAPFWIFLVLLWLLREVRGVSEPAPVTPPPGRAP